jgi:hypothetical protein
MIFPVYLRFLILKATPEASSFPSLLCVQKEMQH